jgi:hypothetical protein
MKIRWRTRQGSPSALGASRASAAGVLGDLAVRKPFPKGIRVFNFKRAQQDTLTTKKWIGFGLHDD